MNKACLIGVSLILLSACSSGQSQETPKDTKETTVKVEKNVNKKKEPTVSEVKVTPLSKKDIDKLLKRDPDETQYENEKFEFKDGTEISADYISYVNTPVSNYALITYLDNQIMSILLEPTDKSKEEVLEYFRLQNTYKEYKINDMTKAVRIIVDERFDKDNIKVYPNEWD
ncbi:MAG: hypothetical protein ACI35O_10360 [Bacillaceae bacterium]